MVKRTGPTNIYLRKLINLLKKEGKKNNSKFWLYVAELLGRSTRKRVEVNLSKLDKYTKDGDTVIVPGKLLGYGIISKKITVAAWKYSLNAKEKLEKSGIKALTIEDLLKANPKDSNIKIII
jgi:Ribosomal protein L18E